MLSKNHIPEMEILRAVRGSRQWGDEGSKVVPYLSRYLFVSGSFDVDEVEGSLLFGYDTIVKQLYQPVQPLAFFPISEGNANLCVPFYEGIYMIPFWMFDFLLDEFDVVLVNDYFFPACMGVDFENVSFSNLGTLFKLFSDGDWLRLHQKTNGLLLFGVTDKFCDYGDGFSLDDKISWHKKEIERLEALYDRG